MGRSYRFGHSHAVMGLTRTPSEDVIAITSPHSVTQPKRALPEFGKVGSGKKTDISNRTIGACAFFSIRLI